MLKYILGIIIIFIVLYFLTLLNQKIYIEPFENKIRVKGATAFEQLVSSLFKKQESDLEVNTNTNSNLGKQTVIQSISNNTDNDKPVFPPTCPGNLDCSDPPTNDEKAILDIYRNKLLREPDVMGFHYWLGRIKTGISIESITQSFINSSEYNVVLEEKEKNTLDELNDLNVKTSIKPENLNRCAANFDETMPCCGNPQDVPSIEPEYICPIEKPICSDYILDKQWGACMSDGGKGDKVTVLGGYNMSPWKLRDSWQDKRAKWIWFEKNADRVAGGSTVGKFEYKFYKKPIEIDKSINYKTNDELMVEIHICADNYAYVYLNGVYLFTQIGGWPNSGVHKDIKIKNGVNHFEVVVVNADITPNSAGLIMTVIGNNHTPIVSTNENWSFISTLPNPDNILMKYRKPNVNSPPELFNPLVALWNRKHKGFLKMNVDTSINKYTPIGKLCLMGSDNKRLPSSYSASGAIFKFSKTQQWMDENSYSLYNCRYSRFIRTNGDTWKIDTGNLNADQDLIENLTWERWIPVYNSDNTVSFKSALWEDRYMCIHDKDTILSKILSEPDENCKWEVTNIETIYTGASRKLIKNTDNKPGFILKVPSYIGYLGQTPINMQYSINKTGDAGQDVTNELVWNDSYINYGLTNVNNDWNTVNLFRTDTIEGDIGWDQPLHLFGIKSNDLKKIKPILEEITKGTAKEIVLSNDKIICVGTDSIPYYRDLYTNSYWTKLDNHWYGSSLVVGEVNREPHMFIIGSGEYTYVWYRKLSDLNKGVWEPYNNIVNDIQCICFDKTDKNLIGLKTNGEMFVFTSRTTQVKINIPNNFVYFSILDKNVGTIMLLIDKEGYLHCSKLSKATADTPVILDNKLPIKKVCSINNMLFAIGKNDGRIYFKPMSKIIPFRLYNSELEGNIIDIDIYNDELFLVNNENKVMRCPIVLS